VPLWERRLDAHGSSPFVCTNSRRDLKNGTGKNRQVLTWQDWRLNPWLEDAEPASHKTTKRSANSGSWKMADQKLFDLFFQKGSERGGKPSGCLDGTRLKT
jgi:hypothetical protein